MGRFRCSVYPNDRATRPRRLMPLWAALALACGPEGFAPPPADEGALVTWGSTAVLYASATAGFPNDNVRLLENFLAYLGAGRGTLGSLRLLYTASCDPRTDPERCQVTSDSTLFEPFFAMIDRLGTLEFALPDQVTLSDYGVVMADFCGLGTDASGREALDDHLRAGGRVMVLADNFCFARDRNGVPVASAALASAFLVPYGIEFTTLDPQPREPFAVSSGHPILEGVETLWIFRVTPQIIEGDAVALVTSDLGVLAATAGVR